MDAAALQEIAARVTRWVAQEPQMKESNVKLRIVEPLLAALGWNAGAGDLDTEYAVKAGVSKLLVDYALLVEGKAVGFVEAKSLDNPLNREEAQQVISYGRIRIVRWCVLTNGRVLRIYDASDKGEPEDCLVSEIDLQDLARRTEEIKLLSKDAIVHQEIEGVVGARKALRKASRQLEDSHGQVVAAVAETLRQFLSDFPEDQLKDLAKAGVLTMQSAIGNLRNLVEDEPERSPRPAPTTRRSIHDRDIPVVARKDLGGEPDGTVIVCPAKIERGFEFFLKYQAWGFIRANRQPKYLGLYLSSPESKILYFAEVDKMTPPLASRSEIEGIDKDDTEGFSPGKRVLWLKPGSIRKLVDPVPAGRAGSVPQNSRYSTLRKFVAARSTGELWQD